MADISAAPLEQFLLLAKGSQGKATAHLIKQVLKHKHTFVFAELLEMDCVLKLKGTDCDPYFRLLSIFSYGTYADYRANESDLPELTEDMLRKLRLLTVCSLASQHKALSYDKIQEALGVADTRELEDVVIAACYAGLVRGKLDQRTRTLHVQWAAGRDLAPGSLDEMYLKLENWCATAEGVMKTLSSSSDAVERTKAEDCKRSATLLERAQAAKNEVRERMEQKMTLGVGGDGIMEHFEPEGYGGHISSRSELGRSRAKGKGRMRGIGAGFHRNK